MELEEDEEDEEVQTGALLFPALFLFVSVSIVRKVWTFFCPHESKCFTRRSHELGDTSLHGANRKTIA